MLSKNYQIKNIWLQKEFKKNFKYLTNYNLDLY